MNKVRFINLFLPVLCSLVFFSAVAQDQAPQTKISNGVMDARLYLPDSEQGYYRGTRFDWSGVISSLEYQGHEYFGKWFPFYDPRLHDAIMGPVEEFGPLGYEEAKTGGSFVKIGVGVLVKPNDSTYNFRRAYEIIDPGKWEIAKETDAVRFFQVVKDDLFSYEYEKHVQLLQGKSEMVLSHHLKNTGRQVIETSVYNHNFFMFDQQPIGPDYHIQFPFTLSGAGALASATALVEDNKITFPNVFNTGQHAYFGTLSGFSDRVEDYDIRIENKKTRSGVRITSDRPLSRLVFWAASTTLSPEPYTQIKVHPGETFSWKVFYQFYTF